VGRDDEPWTGHNPDMCADGRRERPPMSDEHKAALARGREDGRVIRRYLEAIDRQRPRRGRPRTPESIQRRLDLVNVRIAGADSLARLHLLQERRNLHAELHEARTGEDMGELERSFAGVARAYGERKGITYEAWREAGVSAGVLQRAGIARSSR
jgi:hypothetical protein